MCGAVHQLPMYALMVWTGTAFLFLLLFMNIELKVRFHIN